MFRYHFDMFFFFESEFTNYKYIHFYSVKMEELISYLNDNGIIALENQLNVFFFNTFGTAV